MRERSESPSDDDATPTKSALHDANVRVARTLSARRYADIVPGGVSTRVGNAEELARDRALSSRAESLRRALREVGAGGDADARTRERLYEYASVLQEQAERCATNGKDDGLREELTLRACEAYARAAELDGGRHEVYYNWGIALGDRAERASARGDGESARRLWDESIDKYERATRIREMSTVSTQQAAQGLNNLALAYQSRATCVDHDRSSVTTLESAQRAREERVKFLSASVRKFRRALRLDPSFDRAVYNLGTVVYALSVEYASMARLYPQDDTLAPLSRDYAIAAAIYVALALANVPDNDVYAKSFGIVKHHLPTPYVFDEFFSYAVDTGATLEFTDIRLILTYTELRTHPNDDSGIDFILPLGSVSALEPLEDVTLSPRRASAVLHHVSPDAAPIILAHDNIRVRDRVIDAVVITRDLIRRRVVAAPA